jgi:hypothetical protein
MTDMLERATGLLNKAEKAFSTRDIVFVQDDDRVAISASVGGTFFEVDSGFGTIERLESRDYLVDVSALVVNGKQVEPKRGSQVRERIGNVVLVYEVMPFGGEPHFRWHDTYHTRYRIHTKHVKTMQA